MPSYRSHSLVWQAGQLITDSLAPSTTETKFCASQPIGLLAPKRSKPPPKAHRHLLRAGKSGFLQDCTYEYTATLASTKYKIWQRDCRPSHGHGTLDFMTQLQFKTDGQAEKSRALAELSKGRRERLVSMHGLQTISSLSTLLLLVHVEEEAKESNTSDHTNHNTNNHTCVIFFLLCRRR